MAKFNAFATPKGWIEVICGPMFAGKSEELLRRINRLKYADVDYLLFKPKIDTRTKKTAKSRDGREIPAIVIEKSTDIFDNLDKLDEKPHVIAIDEAQFLDEELADVCDHLANNGIIIFIAGLDNDFRGEPFTTMVKLLSIAEKVTKLTAICTECGAEATRTQRIIDGEPASYDSPLVLIGNNESYSARCRHHHIVKNKPSEKKYPKIKK